MTPLEIILTGILVLLFIWGWCILKENKRLQDDNYELQFNNAIMEEVLDDYRKKEMV